MKDVIITIGRQFGSGGREIGSKLSKLLGIPVYDKELISLVAKNMQCGEGTIEFYEEKPPGLLFPTNSLFETYELPMSDKIFIAQSHAIEEIALKTSSCIIVGRAADYVLRKNKKVLRVFIHSDMANRIERKLEIVKDIPKEKMESHIRGIDKKRAKYYGYYTDQKWGDVTSYDLTLNSGIFGIDGCVEIITNAVNR